MAVTDFKAESFLFMVLEVLSPDGNYFEMIVISANFGGKGISIDPGKISSLRSSSLSGKQVAGLTHPAMVGG